MKQIYLILSMLLTICCSHAQHSFVPDRAVGNPSDIDTIITMEQLLAPHYNISAPAGTSWFEYKEGKSRILVTAPHATAQTREGKIKLADAGTGSLAMELHKLRDVPILYTTYLSPSDPNYYDDNEFKDTLAHIIDKIHPVFVIDLHASHPYRPYDVDLGTLNGRSLPDNILDSLIIILRNCGLENISYNFFAGEKAQTDTKFVHNRGIPCIQLEINSNYLSAKGGNENNIYCQKTAQLLESLLKFIDQLK